MNTEISKRIKANKRSMLIAFGSVYIKMSDLPFILKLTKHLVENVISPRIIVKDILHIENCYWVAMSSIPASINKDYEIISEKEVINQYYYHFPNEKSKHDNLTMLYLSLEIAFNSPLNRLDFFDAIRAKNDSEILCLMNSIKAFKFFSDLQVTTDRDKFFLYLNLLYKYCDEPFVFSTKSLTTFKNKLREFREIGINAFLHKNNNNKNASIKFDKKDLSILKEGYGDGVRKSMRMITKQLNTNRTLRGAKRVTIQTVINTIKNLKEYGELYLQRNGSSEISNILMYPNRIQPFNPGDQYQIDGTRFNIPYLNENGNADLLILVALIDVYSKKIMGYILTKSETFQSYFQVIFQAVTETKFLPAEILSDNLPALNSKESLSFMNRLKKFGVLIRRHTPHHPQDKSSIESWFGTFGQLYLKEVPGYLGDGIKSKRKDGKPNEDLIEQYKKKKNLRTRRELEELLRTKIIEYNSNYEFKNSTPNLLFANSTAKNGILLKEEFLRTLFYKEKVCLLSKTGITIQAGNKMYQYLIYDNKINFFIEFLNKEISVRYDPQNMDIIYLHTVDTDNFLFELELHINFPSAQISQSDDDKINIGKFSLARYAVKKHLTKICNKPKGENIDCQIVPIELISEKYDSKVVVDKPIKEYLLTPKKQKLKKTFEVLNTDNSFPSNIQEDIKISIGKMFSLSGSNKLIN